MPVDPVTLGLGAAGLFQSKNANKAAAKQQAKAVRGQDAITQRAIELFDTLMGQVKEMDRSGAFNPEYYIQQAEKDAARTEGRDLENMAGAYRTLGYKPGDSEPQTQLRGVRTRNQEALDRLRADLRRQSFMDRLNAYNSIGTGGLQLGGQIYGQQYSQAQGQMQNPAGMFQSLMPFLQPRPNQSASTPGGGRIPTSVGPSRTG